MSRFPVLNSSKIIGLTFRKQKGACLTLDFETVCVTPGVTAKQKVNGYLTLIKQDVKLRWYRVLGMEDFVYPEQFSTSILFCLRVNPKCLTMFCKQALMQIHELPCGNIIYFSE